MARLHPTPEIIRDGEGVTVVLGGHTISASSVDDCPVTIMQEIPEGVWVQPIGLGRIILNYDMTHYEAVLFLEALDAAIRESEADEVLRQEGPDDLYRGNSDDD